MNRKAKVTTETARQVVNHHFGRNCKGLKELQGGLVNFVFEAESQGEPLVIRISEDPTKLQVYLKEQWAVAKARAKRIPTPEILEVGNEAIGLPYMVARKVAGQPLGEQTDKENVIRQMGEYAAVINAIPTRDFGHVFDWSENRLSRQKSWKDFLQKEMRLDERLDFFRKKQLLRPPVAVKLKRVLQQMETWKGKPTLTHGDLRLKNILVDKKGKICAILDWENCCSNLAPAWEFSIALHDLAIEEKGAFLEGYGITSRDYLKMAPAIKCFNILNYWEVAVQALKQKNKAALEQLKLRLNGDLDLYAL